MLSKPLTTKIIKMPICWPVLMEICICCHHIRGAENRVQLTVTIIIRCLSCKVSQCYGQLLLLQYYYYYYYYYYCYYYYY